MSNKIYINFVVLLLLPHWMQIMQNTVQSLVFRIDCWIISDFFGNVLLMFLLWEWYQGSVKMQAVFLSLLKIVEHQRCQHAVPKAMCLLVPNSMFSKPIVTRFALKHLLFVMLFNYSIPTNSPKNHLKGLSMFHISPSDSTNQLITFAMTKYNFSYPSTKGLHSWTDEQIQI